MLMGIIEAMEPMYRDTTEQRRIMPLMIITRLIPITILTQESKGEFSRHTATQLIQRLPMRIPHIQYHHTIQVRIIPHHRIIITGVNRI
jgi:hypothetical protein